MASYCLKNGLIFHPFSPHLILTKRRIEKEKEENIVREKMFVPLRRRRTEKETEDNIFRRKMFGLLRRRRTKKE